MKKSEKIEIRVSLDEKNQLAALAAAENRSVSEMVRGLARRYAQLNQPRPRRLPVWAMAGIALCGTGLGAGLALGLGGAENQTARTFMVHGTVLDQAFSHPVAFGKKENVTLGGSYSLTMAVYNQDDETGVHVLLCETASGECTSANLDMSQDGSSSIWQTVTPDGKPLFVAVQPVS